MEQLCKHAKNQVPAKQHSLASAGWTALAKHCDIFKGNIRTYLKRQVLTASSNDTHQPNNDDNDDDVETVVPL